VDNSDKVKTKQISTTLGPISPYSLGKVNVHDHIILDGTQNPRVPEDFHHVDVDLISSEVALWKKAGGGAIVDSSPIGAGRNVELLNETSRLSQVPFIVSSGFHKLSYYANNHWLYTSTEEEIASILFAECVDGVLIDDSYPYQSRRSSTKANMLKLGVDALGINPVQSKLINAVVKTSNQLDIPLMIHTEPGVPFKDLMETLAKINADPGRIIICHMGKSLDLPLHRTLTEQGYYLEFDEMVRPHPPLRDLANIILSLFDGGNGNSILFAGDLARRGYWSCYGGQPGLVFLITSLEKELRRLGFSKEMLHQIWTDNPLKLFSK
jgi:phosphotriesterase-related protein